MSLTKVFETNIFSISHNNSNSYSITQSISIGWHQRIQSQSSNVFNGVGDDVDEAGSCRCSCYLIVLYADERDDDDGDEMVMSWIKCFILNRNKK